MKNIGLKNLKLIFYALIFMSIFLNLIKSSYAKSTTTKESSSEITNHQNRAPNDVINQKNIYDFTFTKLIEQEPFKLDDFRNKVILIVNTASKCGFTKQYSGLEQLHQKYYSRGLIIIGVPSADFGGQEFGSNSEIVSFCKFNYGVSFLMTQKEVITGKNAHPFYQYAREKLGIIASPKWNFHKYLIGRNGEIVDYFISSTEPMSDKIIQSIERELNIKTTK